MAKGSAVHSVQSVSLTAVKVLMAAVSTEYNSRFLQHLGTSDLWVTFDGTDPTKNGCERFSPGDVIQLDNSTGKPFEAIKALNDLDSATNNVFVMQI